MNQFTYFHSKTNYLGRKIVLTLISLMFFISILLQISMYFVFFNRIQAEYDYIASGESALYWSVNKILNASTTFQLKEIFWSLNSLVIIFSCIILAFLITMQVQLYRQRANGDKLFIYLFILIPTVFFLLFAINALQPGLVFRGIFRQRNGNDVLINLPIKDKINYSSCWVSMIFAFISIILIIYAKKLFGFIQKDKILNKQLPDTKELKNKIKNILNSNQLSK
ncbi:hypothetical protein V2P29_01025 [Mesomycoplasma hyorhinis]|uniref:hypothetical protein n=1 Tax=Mesomycoplasma hyorhinis TaxID=2100 RepID=UPI0011B46FD1|nr:hypothetical protein EIH16_01670 [Mesomycoplasma hyorhinis]